MEDYNHIRRLAIVDANRRIHALQSKGLVWNIVDRVLPVRRGKPVHTEKLFVYNFGEKFTNITMNEYAIVREVKYIVWRFNISNNELQPLGLVADVGVIKNE